MSMHKIVWKEEVFKRQFDFVMKLLKLKEESCTRREIIEEFEEELYKKNSKYAC